MTSPAMIRTSIFLPRQLRARILAAAKILGIKKSEFARKAIEEYFERRDAKLQREIFPIENMEQLAETGLLGNLTLNDVNERIQAYKRKHSARKRRRSPR